MSKTDKNSEESKEQLKEQLGDFMETVVEEKGEEKDKEAQDTSEAQDEAVVLKEALQKEKDKFLRLFAEFENYKKRTTRERIELFKTASQEVIQAILPVLDDFDRGAKAFENSEDKSLVEGVLLIQDKLKETLKNKGLEEIVVVAGDGFDADLHEAITQIPAPTDELKGKIVDVVEKGYKLGEKIIRFPKVVTGE